MEKIIKYSEYELNESKIEIEVSENGAYLLTIEDIENIVSSFTDTTIPREAILEELENYKFIKVEDAEIDKIEPLEDVEQIEELSSDDENPRFIKKFEEQ